MSNAVLQVKTLTEQRTALRKERELLTGQLVQAEKTIDSNNRAKEADLKQINNLMRERDVFNKNLIKQVSHQPDERSGGLQQEP